MRTRKERAWQELKLAKDRFSDAAIVIAESVAFWGKPPTDAELEAYRNATRALSRAHREYAKAIQNEADK